MNPGPVAPVVAVAFSGGRDSTALLHAVWRQSAGTPLRVVALHVHHGLMPQADHWLLQTREQIRRWSRRDPRLEFRWQRLASSPAAGESIEAWARRERYGALTLMARAAGADTVLLAHHRRDQAETVLLQALRGAGPAGLAAMPVTIERSGLTWIRPWLDQPASAIDHYLQRHRLGHVEDDSNHDRRFARNRVRLDLLPVLERSFPSAQGALAAVARHCQAADRLIDEVATEDLRRLGADEAHLRLAGWSQLSPVRQRFALQAWLRQAALRRQAPPPHELLQAQMLARLAHPGSARWSSEGGLDWQLYRGVLTLAASTGRGAGLTMQTNLPVPVPGPLRLVSPEWQGVLDFEPVAQGGLTRDQLQGAWLLPRRGGELFQAGAGRPPRSLKKQFQAAGVPTWLRNAPLLCRLTAGSPVSQVLFVPGLGVDARAASPAGPRQWRPVWTAHAQNDAGDPLVE